LAVHPDEVLAALRRQPFVPFRLHVADGSSYEIRHPELVWVSPRAAYVGIPTTVPGLVERAVVIGLGHVSRLEELPAPAAPGDGQQQA
jgi:hypothetical protein